MSERWGLLVVPTWNEEFLKLFQRHVATFLQSKVADDRVDCDIAVVDTDTGLNAVKKETDHGHLEKRVKEKKKTSAHHHRSDRAAGG